MQVCSLKLQFTQATVCCSHLLHKLGQHTVIDKTRYQALKGGGGDMQCTGVLDNGNNFHWPFSAISSLHAVHGTPL